MRRKVPLAQSLETLEYEVSSNVSAYRNTISVLYSVPELMMLTSGKGPGPFVTYLHRFGLCSHDRYVCGAKGDPNHYATVCPVTKPFHFTQPSAENLSTWCENIAQDKRSLARLMSIMKILHERRHDIIMD
ncbi:hypothetical protein AVEN_148090-1 [Araneus ventricosus]|uniref:Uncharacterized protein n=1 Tax=Araneus ventricosus TaxID=182803 RepID=A0A4Y2G629_ARAVE|nr:hypothetical protein AVEN_148090-1 [Araneus ventricosus]